MAGQGHKRVAVVGASGIGKHHAKWWALEGAEVCAFVGTSDASVARTRATLEQLFGFSGRGYTDLDALLTAETPDFVDVCSPPPYHAAHSRLALEAGCHVLCEKPLCFDKERSPDTLMADARSLVALAGQRDRLLGVCTQYSKGADGFARFWDEKCGGEPITQYHGHLEAPAKGRPPDPNRIWVDLSPHLLSVLIRLLPGCEVDWPTLDVAFEGYEARASFTVQCPQDRSVACDLVARNTTEPPLNVRHFALNGYRFAVEGENDAEGVYGARVETPDGDYHEADAMRLLIRDMLEGRATAAGDEALANIEWMLQILGVAKAL